MISSLLLLVLLQKESLALVSNVVISARRIVSPSRILAVPHHALSDQRHIHQRQQLLPNQLSIRRQSASIQPISSSSLQRYSSTQLFMENDNDDGQYSSSQEMMELEEDIERMKEEALQKLNVLNNRIAVSNTNDENKERSIATPSINNNGKSVGANGLPSTSNDEKNWEEAIKSGYDPSGLADLRELEENMMDNLETVNKVAVSNDPKTDKSISATNDGLTTKSRRRSELALLDNTVWKISLNIGREPGTWMPKDWAVSGERLLINLELELSDDQLFEREDFLGSIGDAKVCKVLNNELILSPSITEGRRTFKVKDGGWRIVKGAGPRGTDLLRFYIETYQDVRRDNEKSDVYCPSGRIYCSCGYFPTMTALSSGMKDRCKRQLDKMIEQETQLEEEIASMQGIDKALDKIVKSTKLFRLRVDMASVVDRYNDASITEPDTSILRFSQDGNVGLTKEGGVVCKVDKGRLATEYHILGKFSLASQSDRK